MVAELDVENRFQKGKLRLAICSDCVTDRYGIVRPRHVWSGGAFDRYRNSDIGATHEHVGEAPRRPLIGAQSEAGSGLSGDLGKAGFLVQLFCN